MRPGKLSQAALDRSVLRVLSLAGVRGRGAQRWADGAACRIYAEEAVLGRAQGPVGGPMDLTTAMLMERAVDAAVIAGGSPAGLLLALTLPEDAEEAQLKELMQEAADWAAAADLTVLDADVFVTDAVHRPILQVTAVGEKTRRANAKETAPAAGMTLIMTGFAGSCGASLLEHAFHEQLAQRFSTQFLAGIRPAALKGQRGLTWYGRGTVGSAAALAAANGAFIMHAAQTGGIFGALWELGEKAGCGFEIDLKAIPIRQETIEICEQLEVHPYQLYGQGSLLIAAALPGPCLQALQAAGIPAAVIGTLTGGKDRNIRNLDEVRSLEKPQPDSLWNH